MSNMKTIGVVLGGCLGTAVLLIAVFAGLMYYGFRSTDAMISPKMDLLFAAIEEGTFASTYEVETTPAFRSVTSKEQYADLGKSITVRLGNLESRSLQSFKIQQINSRSVLEVTYGAVFENGPGTILAKFEKQNGVWKLLSFRVNSKLFEQDLRTRQCPECGEACGKIDHFCPACGIELTPEEASEEAELANQV